jgi:hypothetical protein
MPIFYVLVGWMSKEFETKWRPMRRTPHQPLEQPPRPQLPETPKTTSDALPCPSSTDARLLSTHAIYR